MAHAHRHPSRPRRRARGGSIPRPGLDGVSLSLDLARGDLYRLIDELARARRECRGELVRKFERAWAEFREASTYPHPRH
jgi:hypothetical protein